MMFLIGFCRGYVIIKMDNKITIKNADALFKKHFIKDGYFRICIAHLVRILNEPYDWREIDFGAAHRGYFKVSEALR